MKVICPYCEEPAELEKGSTVYPKRPDLHDLLFWQCVPCQARVGVHKGTIKPLGRLADSKLRYWKMQAHAAFDPMWKEGKKKRNTAYKWLQKKLNLSSEECHIGMFDVETCKKVVEVCK